MRHPSIPTLRSRAAAAGIVMRWPRSAVTSWALLALAAQAIGQLWGVLGGGSRFSVLTALLMAAMAVIGWRDRRLGMFIIVLPALQAWWMATEIAAATGSLDDGWSWLWWTLAALAVLAECLWVAVEVGFWRSVGNPFTALLSRDARTLMSPQDRLAADLAVRIAEFDAAFAIHHLSGNGHEVYQTHWLYELDRSLSANDFFDALSDIPGAPLDDLAQEWNRFLLDLLRTTSLAGQVALRERWQVSDLAPMLPPVRVARQWRATRLAGRPTAEAFASSPTPSTVPT